MVSTAPKKTVLKKEKQSAAKKKVVVSYLKETSAGSSGTANKTVSVKKKTKQMPSKHKSSLKTAGEKSVVKKTLKEKKSREKTGASKNRLFDLRKSLIRKKETILKEAKDEIAKYVSGENKQLVDTANDEGDWAQVDISEDINLQRLSAHRKLIYNIDETIRKIAEGTYGICEDCGDEISEKRLMVLPTATLCIDCQENREQFEALEGEA